MVTIVIESVIYILNTNNFTFTNKLVKNRDSVPISPKMPTTVVRKTSSKQLIACKSFVSTVNDLLFSRVLQFLQPCFWFAITVMFVAYLEYVTVVSYHGRDPFLTTTPLLKCYLEEHEHHGIHSSRFQGNQFCSPDLLENKETLIESDNFSKHLKYIFLGLITCVSSSFSLTTSSSLYFYLFLSATLHSLFSLNSVFPTQ